MDESLDPEGAGMASEICFVQASSMRSINKTTTRVRLFLFFSYI